MIKTVSRVILSHILSSENNIKVASPGALMFEEVNFLRKRWKIHTSSGFSSTMPVFNYVLEEVKYRPKMP